MSEEEPPKDDAIAMEEDKPEENKDDAKPEEEEEKKPLIGMPAFKKPSFGMDDEPPPESAASDPDKWHLAPCCCCLCACSHERVGAATCFGCCPIKCGVIFIAIFIFFLSIIMLTCSFFQFLNEYLPWWFVFIELLLQIPQITGAMMCVYFFAKDKRTTRSKIPASCILSIISVCLWCTWIIIFFLAIYKKDTVYMGIGPTSDETNYKTSTKKQYIFQVLAETVIIVVILAYWLMVSSQYSTLMNKKYDEEEAE